MKRFARSVIPRRLWESLVWARVRAERELAIARAVGWTNYARLRLPAARPRGPNQPLRHLRLPGYRHPLYYRPGGSDPFVIRQVFGRREYACVLDQPDVRFVLDCGANIGCTTFFFFHHFPEARAVVVEPDPDNMRVCRRNLAPWGDRVAFVEAGIWSASVPLVIERGGFRDGAEWSIQVRPAKDGEAPDLTALTVPDLLARGGFPRVDVLKMDIEAAEVEVFDARAPEWLARVRTLVIETHGPACERAVLGALAGFPHSAGESGELSVYRLQHPQDSAAR